MIQLCSNVAWGINLGYRRSGTVLGLKGQKTRPPNDLLCVEWDVNSTHSITYSLKGQGLRVSKFISHTRTKIHPHSLGGVTSRQRGIELWIECILFVNTLLVCA